jgi:hypothetical protein
VLIEVQEGGPAGASLRLGAAVALDGFIGSLVRLRIGGCKKLQVSREAQDPGPASREATKLQRKNNKAQPDALEDNKLQEKLTAKLVVQPANVANQGGVIISHRAVKLDKLAVQPLLVRVPGIVHVARLLQHPLHLDLVRDGQVRLVAFSPDGRIIASGSLDATVKLWDTATGKELRTLIGHTSLVSTLAFSPDGKILASGGVDFAIRTWDVLTGKPLKVLQQHANGVTAVAFTPDGKTILFL